MTSLAPVAKLIAAELMKLKASDAAFSMRDFAKRIGLSPGTLSQVISGKRNVTHRTAQLFMDRVRLADADARKIQELLAQPSTRERFDERGIRELLRSFTAFWNEHDTARMAAAWDEQGCLIEPWGLVLEGRRAIHAFYRMAHSTYLKDASIDMRPTAIRFMSKGTAFLDIRATIHGMRRPEDRAPVNLDMNIPATLVRRKGGWKFHATRPHLLLSQSFAPWKTGT